MRLDPEGRRRSSAAELESSQAGEFFHIVDRQDDRRLRGIG
jgi:hypothetical protein